MKDQEDKQQFLYSLFCSYSLGVPIIVEGTVFIGMQSWRWPRIGFAWAVLRFCCTNRVCITCIEVVFHQLGLTNIACESGIIPLLDSPKYLLLWLIKDLAVSFHNWIVCILVEVYGTFKGSWRCEAFDRYGVWVRICLCLVLLSYDWLTWCRRSLVIARVAGCNNSAQLTGGSHNTHCMM